MLSPLRQSWIGQNVTDEPQVIVPPRLHYTSHVASESWGMRKVLEEYRKVLSQRRTENSQEPAPARWATHREMAVEEVLRYGIDQSSPHMLLWTDGTDALPLDGAGAKLLEELALHTSIRAVILAERTRWEQALNGLPNTNVHVYPLQKGVHFRMQHILCLQPGAYMLTREELAVNSDDEARWTMGSKALPTCICFNDPKGAERIHRAFEGVWKVTADQEQEEEPATQQPANQ